MVYVPLEKLLDKSDYSIYKLVILASKRALEIAEGQPKLVACNVDIKPSTVALYEIAQGRVQLKKKK
ncbi:MAG: DNA-directed RNA polymerase subunit omega [Candidatus Omnitrophica bacterium]|nr:DNA-directed RNA polymerase subunit omega [Candidatus Omnitrophota bacterium]MBU4472908.1 DNA-directed RNA polymerase subunit omega [Candidatus Omnitrophota bacterium]MCG2706156.1 DNA-directed RNA polymerase subunit omega [Candidatus Omnitrophota bacterium]